MPRAKKWPPVPHAHAASGLDRIRVDGKEIYLGKTGSPEAKAAYDDLLARLTANSAEEEGPPLVSPVTGLTVSELIEQYDTFAKGYYQKNSAPTKQYTRVRKALSFVLADHGALSAAKFGPLALSGVREKMVALGWKRHTVNLHVGCIVTAWSWAAEMQLVPAAAWQALKALRRLKKGKTTAGELRKVKPPDAGAVEGALVRMPRIVADMARVQRLTGMRSGELCRMTPAQIDRSQDVWVYRPVSHKTEDHEQDRAVPIGPRAQAVLAPYLRRRAANAFLFSPRESHKGRLPQGVPGEKYTSGSYGTAIRRACVRAGVAHVFPHQLRHETATHLRQLFGIEITMSVLGHADSGMTEIYAERSLEAAIEAARKAG